MRGGIRRPSCDGSRRRRQSQAQASLEQRGATLRKLLTTCQRRSAGVILDSYVWVRGCVCVSLLSAVSQCKLLSTVNWELASGLFFCGGRREHRPLFWSSVTLKIKRACSAAGKPAHNPGLHLYPRLRRESDIFFKSDHRTSIDGYPAVVRRSIETFSIILNPDLP